MFYKIKQWPRQIRQGIKSLIIWFPVIWQDRWYDHYFIYAILRHKLHLMEHNIRLYGIHTKHIEDADKIKKCVILLDRLMKDEYHENVFKDHYKKWGEPKMRFEDYDKDPELQELHIDYPKVQTEEDKKLQTKEFRLKSKSVQEMINQDVEMLFTLMRKNIQTWWD